MTESEPHNKLMPAVQAARSRLHERILNVIESTGCPYIVRGSFGCGDFHYDHRKHHTLSDLDLLYPCDEDERQVRAAAIGHALKTREHINLRVSVQPADHQGKLSLEDSRYLVIGEFLRHYRYYLSDDERLSYLLAKTTLGVLRRSQGERYCATAKAINTPLSYLAMDVKLGEASGFSVCNAVELLTCSGARTPETELMLNALKLPNGHDLSDEYLLGLNTRSSVSPWLRKLFNKLLNPAD